MDHKQKMAGYIALVEDTTTRIKTLNEAINREVSRRYGDKLEAAKTPQERENLREFYVRQLSRENIWKTGWIGDRALYISLATMHGIAALVEKQ